MMNRVKIEEDSKYMAKHKVDWNVEETVLNVSPDRASEIKVLERSPLSNTLKVDFGTYPFLERGGRRESRYFLYFRTRLGQALVVVLSHSIGRVQPARPNWSYHVISILWSHIVERKISLIHSAHA
jgi:hypothetical protein